MHVNRRQFLLATGLVAAGVAGVGCAPGASYADDALARPALLDELGPARVRAIGEKYRAARRDERSVHALRAAILDSRPLASRLLGAAAPSAPELVRDDFAHGRTVVVDGWVLAVTEARQCALYSLRTA
ncbi:MAG: hypothetical protein HOQ09_04020 [Gemmatimonadaceae bacterium]|nr:hypothetical protein [Gemmatimonadaceae bacterium]